MRELRATRRRPESNPRFAPGIRSMVMSKGLQDVEPQTFVETALKLGGKSEEEARKTGSLDRADEQVEALFALQYQTAHSPVHRAVWDRAVPVELFAPTPPTTVPPGCARVMQASLEVARRHKAAGTLFDARGKISE